MSRNKFSNFLKRNQKLKLFIYYIVCFLLFDYFLGQKILNYAYENNILQNVNTKIKIISENEKKYRISHPIFHHTLKKNMNVESQWGEFIYKTCTKNIKMILMV